MKCVQKLCLDSTVVTDNDTGEVICSRCGSVLAEKIESFGPEHYTQSAEQYFDKSRTGSKSTLAIDDRGLSTVIGVKNEDATGRSLSYDMKNTFNRLRLWDSRSKSRSTERSLRSAFMLLGTLKEKLGIPDSVVENTAYLYRKAVAKKLTRGRNISALLAAALYVSCKDANIPRTLNDVSKSANLKPNDVSKHLRLLVESLDLKLASYDSSDFVSRIASTVGIGEKSRRNALVILASAKEKGLIEGKNPIAMAATSLYLSSVMNKENKTQREIARASGISEVTIRSRTRFLIEVLNLHGIAV
jgi:transcription initiation factor TFIIB